MTKIIQFLVLVALLIIIPMAWWYSLKSFSSVKGILLSTGISLFFFGVCYKLMGSWDLIPDWIPILGSLDDSFAWGAMIMGLGMGGASYLL